MTWFRQKVLLVENKIAFNGAAIEERDLGIRDIVNEYSRI